MNTMRRSFFTRASDPDDFSGEGYSQEGAAATLFRLVEIGFNNEPRRAYCMALSGGSFTVPDPLLAKKSLANRRHVVSQSARTGTADIPSPKLALTSPS
jgi:hypothetical protein